MSEIIIGLLTWQNQIKLYHWQTTLYSRHKSTDKYFEKLSSNIDRFIETYQGIYGRIYLKKNNLIKLEDLDDDSIQKCCDYMIKWFVKIIGPKIKNNPDLLTIRDEMLADLNQLKYLFSLK